MIVFRGSWKEALHTVDCAQPDMKENVSLQVMAIVLRAKCQRAGKDLVTNPPLL